MHSRWPLFRLFDQIFRANIVLDAFNHADSDSDIKIQISKYFWPHRPKKYFWKKQKFYQFLPKWLYYKGKVHLPHAVSNRYLISTYSSKTQFDIALCAHATPWKVIWYWIMTLWGQYRVSRNWWPPWLRLRIAHVPPSQQWNLTGYWPLGIAADWPVTWPCPAGSPHHYWQTPLPTDYWHTIADITDKKLLTLLIWQDITDT